MHYKLPAQEKLQPRERLGNKEARILEMPLRIPQANQLFRTEFGI